MVRDRTCQKRDREAITQTDHGYPAHGAMKVNPVHSNVFSSPFYRTISGYIAMCLLRKTAKEVKAMADVFLPKAESDGQKGLKKDK